jgi:hypothetical protein
LDDRGSVPDRAGFFSSPSASRPALGPTHLPVQWVPGFFLGVERPGLEAVSPHTHTHLLRVSVFRMFGVIPVFYHTSAWYSVYLCARDDVHRLNNADAV